MAWNFEQDKPIYIQIVNRIEVGILSGEYESGAKLESVRELASKAGVNPNTMQKALQELENMKLLHTQRTSGRYITDDKAVIDKLKIKMAGEKIILFIDNMKKLGFTMEEIENMIKAYHKQGSEAFEIKEETVKKIEEISKKTKAVGNLEDLLKKGE
ncbi:MAG: GntR family transcriptional regulator [Proteocatella sp.]